MGSEGESSAGRAGRDGVAGDALENSGCVAAILEMDETPLRWTAGVDGVLSTGEAGRDESAGAVLEELGLLTTAALDTGTVDEGTIPGLDGVSWAGRAGRDGSAGAELEGIGWDTATIGSREVLLGTISGTEAVAERAGRDDKTRAELEGGVGGAPLGTTTKTVEGNDKEEDSSTGTAAGRDKTSLAEVERGADADIEAKKVPVDNDEICGDELSESNPDEVTTDAVDLKSDGSSVPIGDNEVSAAPSGDALGTGRKQD